MRVDQSTVWGAIAGAIMTIIISILHRHFNIVLEPEEIGAGTLLLGLVVQHFTPNSPSEVWTQEHRAAEGLPAVPPPPPKETP